jgi:DNA-binding CsgD family transcriptional regulator
MTLGDHEAAVKATEQIETLASDPDSTHGMAIRYCRGTLDRDPLLLGPLAEDHRRAGYRLLLAQALESLAEAWAERGQLDRAREALVEALETYQSLGAVWDLNRVRARFRRYGLRIGTQPVARRADHGWESLSPTETRIAAFVAQGLSNPQIGERLFLSRRTVQTHVSHILTKLDVRSRVEITRLVVEQQPED